MVFNKRWFTVGLTLRVWGRWEGGSIWDCNLPRIRCWERPRWKAKELKGLQIPSGTLPSESDGFIKDTEVRRPASWGTSRKLIIDKSTIFSWVRLTEIPKLHEGCRCPIKRFNGGDLNLKTILIFPFTTVLKVPYGKQSTARLIDDSNCY